jgi:hypothetical protein
MICLETFHAIYKRCFILIKLKRVQYTFILFNRILLSLGEF